MSRPLLEVAALVKQFPVRRGLLRRRSGLVRAVDRVSLAVERGECLALVGESGSGKTTLGRCMIRLVEPTSGAVRFDGEDLLALSGAELRRRRRRFQMIFQDPNGSLDPRQRVGRSVGEPLEIHSPLGRREHADAVAELLATVGLAPSLAGRYPHQLSGGQRQRVGIARALATRPELVIADEPISALDVSVRAQILNLLADLRQRFGLTLLLIAHDLAVVRQVADRVAVLYMGRLVELAPRRRAVRAPAPPLHREPAGGGAAARPAAARAGPGAARRRSAQPAPAAARLPVPSPLPGGGGALRRRRAGPGA